MVKHAERLRNVILARACLGTDGDHIRLNDRRAAGRTTDARAGYNADVQAADQLPIYQSRAECDVPLQGDEGPIHDGLAAGRAATTAGEGNLAACAKDVIEHVLGQYFARDPNLRTA